MWIKRWVTPGIAERSVDPERLGVELQEREEKDGEEELVEPLVRLKVEEEKEDKEEHVEPLVRLVRYDSSIPNALDSILPRYMSNLKTPMPHHLHDEVHQRCTAAHLPSYSYIGE